MKAKSFTPVTQVQVSTLGMVGVTVHLQSKTLMSPLPQSWEAGGSRQAGCGPQPAGGDSPAP